MVNNMNKKLRLLRVISSVNPLGGGPIEGIIQSIGPMRDLGVEVEVACCDSPDAPWLNEDGILNIHPLGPASSGYSYTNKLSPWLLDNCHRFDAVIVSGIWQYHAYATWRALSGKNVPYFIFTHGMLDPWFKKKYPLKHLKKWIYWLLVEYKVLRDARAVIFTCEEERVLARKSFWLYKINEVVTNYGTSTPPVIFPEDINDFLICYPELQGKRVILFCSRIHEKKGCDLLIKAYSEVVNLDKNLHLLIVGPGEKTYTSQLRLLSEKLGVADRITWTGMLTGRSKWVAFNIAEVFCLPSHQENFGIVVAEALASGKPVLISNKVNIWREIEAGKCGFINEDTVNGTVRSLRSWLLLDPKKYFELSFNAKKCFYEKFYIKTSAQRLIEIIKEFKN